MMKIWNKNTGPIITSVYTEMCCPKGNCGCQYFILSTLKKKIHGHRGPGFFK
jgi:hypothetical protein